MKYFGSYFVRWNRRSLVDLDTLREDFGWVQCVVDKVVGLLSII